MRKLIVGLVALVALAVVIAGCAPTAPEGVMEKEEEVMEEKPEEVMEEKEEVMEEKEEVMMEKAELLSDLSCADEKVTAVFTNTGSEELDVADVEFWLNVVPDPSPDCDAETLAPGESTVCSGLDVVKARAGTKSIVRVVLPDGPDMFQDVRC